jgi:hypothetical protein
VNDDTNAKKPKRNPMVRMFIVNESYAGKKKLSDIFADLLYSAYAKSEPGTSGNGISLNGCLPTQTGRTHCGGGAY